MYYEECFVTNSLMGVMPVRQLGNICFPHRAKADEVREVYEKEKMSLAQMMIEEKEPVDKISKYTGYAIDKLKEIAGFISRKWFPVFANYRRDGYDFDALFEDEKAPYKHKKIMDFFMEEKYLKTVCFLPSDFSLL